MVRGNIASSDIESHPFGRALGPCCTRLRILSAVSLEVGPVSFKSTSGPKPPRLKRFFYFFYFLFSFFTKIYFCFRNLQEYTLTAPLPGGRGFSKKDSRKIYARAPGGPVVRQRGGRPPRPPASGAAGSGRPAAGRPPPF